MRTTLNLDAEIINAARKLAAARDMSLGEVISELARRGLEAAAPTARRKSGFPVFKVRPNTAPLTLGDVKRDEDET